MSRKSRTRKSARRQVHSGGSAHPMQSPEVRCNALAAGSPHPTKSSETRRDALATGSAHPMQSPEVRCNALTAAAGSLAAGGYTADGYSNAAAFLGADSPLFAAGTFRRSGLTMDRNLLTTTYRECWLATRIIDTPAEDMTRSWYALTGRFDPEDLADLRRLEAKHSVRQELTDAIRWARLYGGSLALMVIDGEGGRLDQPLDLQLLPPDCFRGLLVLDQTMGISPSLELETDINDPDYGLPLYYTVTVDDGETSTVRIHHSRLLRFVGRPLPRMEEISENYWGASELEHIWDELQKRSATSANIAQLVFQANITTLKMANFGESVGMGTAKGQANIRNLIAEENRFRTSFGLQLLSKDDSLENHPYSFSGLSEIYEAFMMDIAGAAEIPATRLFGRSPQGFEATGESDLRNYYEMIAGLQERHLRPALERLLPVMAISCFGFLPEDLDFIFNPLATETPQERAEVIAKLADPVIRAYQAGIISRESTVEELKALGEPFAAFTKIQPQKEPDAPRQPTGTVLTG